jgi:hypothetical protein
MLAEPTAAPTPLTATPTSHRHRRPSVRLLAAVAALTLVVSGCGLFSSDDETSSTTVAPASPAGPDDEAAGDAMLTVEDFPDGWDATNVNPGLVDGLVATFPECSGLAAAVSEAKNTQSGAAGPVSFTSGAERVDIRLQVFPDEATATAVMDDIIAADPSACEGTIVNAAAAGFGLNDQPVDATFNANSGLGDASATVTVVGQSDGGPTTIELTWVRVGRAVVSMLGVVPPPGTFDPDTYTDLIVTSTQEALA